MCILFGKINVNLKFCFIGEILSEFVEFLNEVMCKFVVGCLGVLVLLFVVCW